MGGRSARGSWSGGRTTGGGPRGGGGPWGGWGWGGPPPWARPGGPWANPFDAGGRGGPGSHGRRRGPRGRGDVRLAIVGLLAEQPMHGYQLIQEITGRSEGRWRPSPGSVYPTLSQLEDEGLVRAEEADGRKVFRLTEAGTRLAAERDAEFTALWRDDSQPLGAGLRELGEVLVQVGGAAVQVATAGSEAQRRAAAEVLERTRRELYLLLAEAEPDEADAEPGDGAEPIGDEPDGDDPGTTPDGRTQP
ncbi:MAG TPA: PadR family transcriptional regulator [Jiangellales bacterium]|nr:PadR family transcriptional regulator [Jiangellales bacterium]